MLQPLTKLISGKVEFKWTNAEQKVFDNIKQILVHYTLLAIQYFNKIIEIHAYARELKLGQVIIKEVKLIAFYNIKLTKPRKYMQKQKYNY